MRGSGPSHPKSLVFVSLWWGYTGIPYSWKHPKRISQRTGGHHCFMFAQQISCLNLIGFFSLRSNKWTLTITNPWSTIINHGSTIIINHLCFKVVKTCSSEKASGPARIPTHQFGAPWYNPLGAPWYNPLLRSLRNMAPDVSRCIISIKEQLGRMKQLSHRNLNESAWISYLQL